MESSGTKKRKLIGGDEIGRNRMDGMRDGTEQNGTVWDGTARNMIGFSVLGWGRVENDGTQWDQMGLNRTGWEKTGRDEMQQEGGRKGGSLSLFFRIDK